MPFIPFGRRRVRLACLGALSVLATAMAVACQGVQGESTSPPAPRAALRIAHTWEGDERFTAVFHRELDRLMPDVDVTLIYSTAGITNLSLLQRGEVDAVSTYADI